jgi:hydroxypyruvate isomerase
MAKFCVCLDTVFPELSFQDRMKKITALGFSAFEFWFCDEKNVDQIAKLSKELNLEISDFVINAPDGSVGGSLTNPEDRQKYLRRLGETISTAKKLDCKKLITCSGNKIDNLSQEKQIQSVINTLKDAAKIAEKEGITLLLESLNSRVDHPGYLIDSSGMGFDIVKEVNSPNLRLLYDIYHMQIMEGDIISTIEKNLNLIGHFHSAGVPGRHEINTGELNYANIIKKIDELGYKGYFGFEYFPTMESEKSLKMVLNSL